MKHLITTLLFFSVVCIPATAQYGRTQYGRMRLRPQIVHPIIIVDITSAIGLSNVSVPYSHTMAGFTAAQGIQIDERLIIALGNSPGISAQILDWVFWYNRVSGEILLSISNLGFRTLSDNKHYNLNRSYSLNMIKNIVRLIIIMSFTGLVSCVTSRKLTYLQNNNLQSDISLPRFHFFQT